METGRNGDEKTENDDPEAEGAENSILAPSALRAKSGAGKRPIRKRPTKGEAIRDLERINKELLVRIKELELKQVGGTGQGANYELSEETTNIIAAVEGLYGQIDVAYDLKEALEVDLAATQKKLSEQEALRGHLEGRMMLLEAKAALADQLREDISFVEEEQTGTIRRLRDVTSQMEQVIEERDGLAEKRADDGARVEELQNERVRLEVQVLGLKNRLAEMVSMFGTKRLPPRLG
jgi:chromosome segregation ATPase